MVGLSHAERYWGFESFVVRIWKVCILYFFPFSKFISLVSFLKVRLSVNVRVRLSVSVSVRLSVRVRV